MRKALLFGCCSALLWLTKTSLIFAEAPLSAAQPVVAQKAASEVAPLVAPLGHPEAPFSISLSAEANGVVLLHAGKASSPVALDQPAALELQKLSVGGNTIAIVRASVQGKSMAALITRRGQAAPVIAWVGRTDLHGDPSERIAEAIEVSGDPVQISVGSYDERVRLCGEEHTLLGARTLGTSDLAWHASPRVLLDRPGVARETVSPVEQSPGPAAAPLVRGLRAVSASNASTGQEPQRASDGDLTSAWRESDAKANGARFLTFRWELGARPIRALAITFATSDKPDAKHPTAVAATSADRWALVSDHARQLDLTLPAGGSLVAGRRYWITPAQPIEASCLSLVIEHGTPMVAELEAYSELDFGSGVDGLVEALLRDDAQSADAAELLTRLGETAVAPLRAAWPRMNSQTKRRALRVVAPYVSTQASALETMQLALQDTDSEVAAAALELAVSGLPKTLPVLAQLATQPSRLGDHAAHELARRVPAQAVAPLLAAFAAQGGAERAALREALVSALEHGQEPAKAALDAWLAQSSNAPLAARASVALALAGLPAVQTEAAQLVTTATPAATEFSDQWRLALAAERLASDPATDAWLSGIAQHADAWMLRAQALEALSARHASGIDTLAVAALADSYPRVRMAALQALAAASIHVELLYEHALKDKWFSVRSAALDVLPASAASAKVLMTALDDGSHVVRATAIHGLAEKHVASAWSAVAHHVEDSEEYPEVIEEGIVFARRLCLDASAPSLQAVVKRGLKPEAWAPDQELALSALEALSVLGGKNAQWALDHAQGPLVPKPVRAQAERMARGGAKCVSN